jgi:hypothetical protein
MLRRGLTTALHSAASAVSRTASRCCADSIADEWANYLLSSLSKPLAGLMGALTVKRRQSSQGGGQGANGSAGTSEEGGAQDGGSSAGGAGRVEVIVPSIEKRREFWKQYATREFPLLAKAAERLLNMHVTTCASERNWSVWGKVYSKDRNRLSISLGEQIVFLRGALGTPGSAEKEEMLLAELFKQD